jgi:hypothetical protein
MNSTQRDHLLAYKLLAREHMLRYMPPNSCISAARLTLEWCKRHRIKCRPQAAKMAFQVNDMNKAYTSGLSDEELATAHKCDKSYGEGWRGHVVVVVENKIVLDPSLDQANCIFETPELQPLVYSFPFGKPFRYGSKVEIKGTLDKSERAFTLTYVGTDNDSYLTSEAWNDRGLPIAAEHIDHEVREAVRRLNERTTTTGSH